jgi:DNA polymerase-1
MYLTPTENHWATDIEADNLLEDATCIWCVCMENVSTGEKHEFTDSKSFVDWARANPSCIYVGHNFIAYDAVMLNRHWGAGIPANRIVDTFVLSQLYSPGFKGGHSLEAWGGRLKFPKGDFHDFSHLSPEMLAYCRQDASLTALLFRKLSERMRSVGFTERGAEIEHLAWNIIQNKQRRNGFPFDYKKAHELYVTLRAREEELSREIYKLWPPKLQCVAERKSAFKKDGSASAKYSEDVGKFPKLEVRPDGTYRVFDYVTFNLGSPSQRIEKLLELGWEPTARTKAGNPKVDEDALLAFAETSGQAEVRALAQWIVTNSRANMLNTWLNAYNEKTGCIHGKLFLAATMRYRHSGPNSANIPAVRLSKNADGSESILYGRAGAWTYESRDCWTAGGAGWTLVGLDGTGIQNRCLIHNLTKLVGPERVKPFRELGLSGDIHKHNIQVLGLVNKAAAKKFYYTLMMGGGGGRLAADQAQFGTKMTARQGDKLRRMMIASIPGFTELIAKLEDELSKSGRIKLCDGTPILVPSPHMVIPYLLQGDESRLMKQAMIYVDQEVRRHGLNDHVLKVADIHDEWQYRVRNEYVSEFINLALPCFIRAGESFDYLIPIEGDAKPGKTWAETH